MLDESRDLLKDQEYSNEVVNAIESSKIMILIFSESVNDSPHILRKLEIAVKKGVIIIPFKIHQIEPTLEIQYYLGTSQWVDALTHPVEQYLPNLVGTIKSLLSQLDRRYRDVSEKQPSIRKMPFFSSPTRNQMSLIILVLCVCIFTTSFVGYLYFNQKDSLPPNLKPFNETPTPLLTQPIPTPLSTYPKEIEEIQTSKVTSLTTEFVTPLLPGYKIHNDDLFSISLPVNWNVQIVKSEYQMQKEIQIIPPEGYDFIYIFIDLVPLHLNVAYNPDIEKEMDGRIPYNLAFWHPNFNLITRNTTEIAGFKAIEVIYTWEPKDWAPTNIKTWRTRSYTLYAVDYYFQIQYLYPVTGNKNDEIVADNIILSFKPHPSELGN